MRLRRITQVQLALLVLQFILGMLANLYATIPKHQPYEVFHHVGYISLHAANAVLLTVMAIVIVVKSRRHWYVKPAIVGLANLIIAFIFGEIYVFLQYDLFSLFMAAAFMGAILSYSRIVYTTAETPK